MFLLILTAMVTCTSMHKDGAKITIAAVSRPGKHALTYYIGTAVRGTGLAGLMNVFVLEIPPPPRELVAN